MSNRWESPIARLRLDNNANDAYGTYNGSASNVTYGTTTPKEGSHYSILNGSTSKVTINSLDVQSLEFFTISFWVNGSAAQAYKHFYSQGNSGNDQLYYRLLCSDGTGLCALEVKGAGGVLISQWGNKVILDGSWHFVTLVDNSGTPTLYVDGVKDTGITNTYTYEDISLNQTSIGVLSRTSDADFIAANFDDFRVYNVALSAAEVRNLYLSYDRQPLWNYISRYTLNTGNTDSGPLGIDMTSTTGNAPSYVKYPKVEGSGAMLCNVGGLYRASQDFLLSAGRYSVSYLLNITSDITSGYWCFFLINDSGTKSSISTIYQYDPKRLWFRRSRLGISDDNSYFTANFEVGKWYHIVQIWDGTNVYGFVNLSKSTPTASSGAGSGVATNGGSIMCGMDSTASPNLPATGVCDDMRFYNFVLSDAQVKQLYNSYHGQYQLTQGTIV